MICIKHGVAYAIGSECRGCKEEKFKADKEERASVRREKEKVAKQDDIKRSDPVSSWNHRTVKNFRTKSKYNNVTTEFNGHKYDSKLEAKIAQELEYRKRNGEIIRVDRQYKIPLQVNGVHICNYYIDFVYVRKDGSVVFCEVKGLEQPLWKLKWRLLCALINDIEPGAELEVIKEK